MEGTKIKNIVIMILLLLNGFLLVLAGGRWAQDDRSHDTARGDAIAILREAGIVLEDDIVPAELSLPELQAQRDLTREREQAARLLGSSVTVQARGGDVYRYESELGWLQIHSTGEFLAEFAPGAFPVGEDAARRGMELLAALEFESVVLEQSDGSVVLGQTVNGVRVLDCQAELRFRDGAVAAIEAGRRVSGQPYGSGEQSPVSEATVLMRLYNGLNELGDIYNRIDSMEPAYTMNVTLSGPAQLIPVWYVKTDTGAYQMDVQTGQVSRMGGRTAPSVPTEASAGILQVQEE